MACNLQIIKVFKNPIACGRIFLCSIFFLTFLGSNVVSAQHIDNHSSISNFKEQRSFQLHYDNDLFRGTDYYYTQGFNIQIKHPKLVKNPINKVLLGIKLDSLKRYAMSFESASYTPTSIASDLILYNDRPFAAATSLSFSKYSKNSSKKYLLVSQLNLGMIGPAVLGKEVQSGIHKATNNSIPKGWQHQIKNDLLLNYKLTLEKELIHYSSVFGLSSVNQLNSGTFQTNISTGINAVFGKKESIYNEQTATKFQAFIYSQTLARLVVYDATLMGGMFNRSSPFTYSPAQIERVVFEQHLGVCVKFNKVVLSFDLGYLTNEFKRGKQHAWGGIRFVYMR